MPAGDEQLATEHAERIADEQAESTEQGYPEYEVRIQCSSHHDARQLVTVSSPSRSRRSTVGAWS